MGLIFLFRRLVFAQVLLGIVAFCMAERNPGMLLVAGALGALSWYVVEGPTGRPLPQWVIIPGAFAAVGWLLLDLYWQKGDVILAMGHFTMWLQILLLYAKKTNREYGEILVLSLMQMIGASVQTVSMVFGILLVVYCTLALFTILLFQLKITSDTVLEANQKAAPGTVTVSRPKAVVSRGHRWQFRTTALGIGASCTLVAVLVFLMLPRSGQSKLNPDLVNPWRQQAGFSAQVHLTGAPLNAGSREPVLNIRLRSQGEPLRGEQMSWLLRGAALEQYDAQNRTWVRGYSGSRDVTLEVPDEGLDLLALPEKTPMIEAQITLRDTADRTLFSLHPVAYVQSHDFRTLVFNPEDQQLATAQTVHGALRYTVRAPLLYPLAAFEQYAQLAPAAVNVMAQTVDTARRGDSDAARNWHVKRPQVRALAVEVLNRAKLKRDPEIPSDANDEAVASALATYLRQNFSYTLTNAAGSAAEEPTVEFLLNTRRGHCELFASGLAALARSVGLRARVITGYRVSEYNRIGGYYVVRQNHAHAWTEIFIGNQGWKAYDATPPDAVTAEHVVDRGWLTGVRELYEHLEFAWISSVVSYDNEQRERLIGNLNTTVRKAAQDEQSWFAPIVAWLKTLPDKWQFDRLSYTLMGIIGFFILVGLASLVHTLMRQRQRLAALQLTRLPRRQRRQLAKRLRFYLSMLDLLERYGYVRPSWQSPFGFAQELADANPMRFDPVVALTELFYEIRFGNRDLDQDRQTRVRAHLRQLEAALSQKGAA